MTRTITIAEVRDLEEQAQDLWGDVADIRLTQGIRKHRVEPTINWSSYGARSTAYTADFALKLASAAAWVSSLDCIGAEIIWPTR